ncbi:MAG: hypothetical protein PVJ76_07110 [Gemmatimonadota bacterium]|jgi:hypothetical protein
MPEESSQRISCSESELQEGLRVHSGARFEIRVSEASGEVYFKVPYSAEHPLDNEMEVTFFATDGTYNRTLLVAEQEEEEGRRVLHYTSVPVGKRYGATLAWVDPDTGEKTSAWSLFDDVSWESLENQEEGG